MNTCACCGCLTIDEKGNYEICHICYWEDDSVQEANPWFEGGPNKPSLFQAQLNFKKFGAMEERFVRFTKNVKNNENRDVQWRKLIEEDKLFVTTPRELEKVCGSKNTVSYNYWIRNKL